MPLHVLLREIREGADLTQEELAARSGVGVGTIRRYEQGKTKEPGFVAVMKLMKACEHSLDRLMAALYQEDPQQPLPRRRRGRRGRG